MAAQNGLMFGIQRNLLHHISNDHAGHFYSGCITGAIQTIVSSPVELAKIQLQMQGIGEKMKHQKDRRYTGPFNVLKSFYKSHGVCAGVYRGFWITLLRDCPASGTYFYSYVYFCDMFTPKHKTTLGIMGLLVAGGLAGITSWAIVYPIDVIKTRIQIDGFMPHGRYKNYFECLIVSYKNEGLGVFTKGLAPTLVRAFPVNAATLCTFTLIERILHKST